MFSNNEKISPRQLTRLLILDWTGKLCLLLPILLHSAPGWEGIAALLLGGIWAMIYAGMLGGLSEKINIEFTGYVKERLGNVPAKLVGIFFFVYLLLNQAYLARAVGEVCGVFLLPESSENMTGFLFLLAGWAAACGSMQKRARTAECLFPVIAVMLVVMLAASAESVQWENLRKAAEDGINSWRKGKDSVPVNILIHSGCAFAALSGMGITLYQMPYINKSNGNRKNTVPAALKKSVIITGIFMTAIFVIMLGAFGSGDLNRLEWPVLVLMSNVNIPGGFLQRWDIIFLSVLLFSLLVASGTGIYYMGRILGELFPKVEEGGLQAYCVGICAAVMLIAGEYDVAEKLFARWALCAMMPLITAFPILLWVLERVKKCRKG